MISTSRIPTADIMISFVQSIVCQVSRSRVQRLTLGTPWNEGFSSNIIYVRHFWLFGASAWLTTGMQAVCGRCRCFWTV